MVDLTTNYAGLELKNPLVPSSSPLTEKLDDAKRLEDAGCSALVLPSLFEEALISEAENMTRFLDHQDIGHPEADSFLPNHTNFVSSLDQYLERIQQFKSALDIPVIGSLNGITRTGWVEHARDLQEAGCDAIELNVYGVNGNKHETGSEIEDRYIGIIEELADSVTIPFVVKISSQFTSLCHFVSQVEKAGARGVSMFNRFYQPDIDLDTLAITPRLTLSTPYETLLRIRWVAILRPQVNLGLAVTGGFHRYQDMLKALLAGADVIHLCSLLLEKGIDQIPQLLNEIACWLEEREYDSISQLKGSLSYQHAINPEAYERANYLQVLDSYHGSQELPAIAE